MTVANPNFFIVVPSTFFFSCSSRGASDAVRTLSCLFSGGSSFRSDRLNQQVRGFNSAGGN